MADEYGINATKSEAGGLGDNTVDPGQYKAKVYCMIEEKEADAVAQNKTIQLGEALPDGVRIVDVKCWGDALGSSTAIKVGDSHDDDRYIGSFASTSAFAKSMDKVDGVNYVIGTNTGDNRILLKSNNTGALTGTIKAIIFFTFNQ